MNITVNSAATLAAAHRSLDEAFNTFRYFQLDITRKGGTRTLSQNNALHLFCRELAETLNATGLDQRKVLKPSVDIPWDQRSVKDKLWRPIQEALTGIKSTTEITTVDPTAIHETLCRHLADKFGVVCPAWPSREVT